MTRVILICAGPTPWEAEDRLMGNQSLPLTPEAIESIKKIADSVGESVESVYCCKINEACLEACKLIASAAKVRTRDVEDLDEMNLGLWQGLRREDLRFRFKSAFEQWEDNPLSVNPPEGESLERVITRLRSAMKKILRKNRDSTAAIAVRPIAMQVVIGALKFEEPPAIARHLHQVTSLETIELSRQDLHRFLL